jgi:hypothetical protein
MNLPCVTSLSAIIRLGSKAMFADLGHFSYSAIQTIPPPNPAHDKPDLLYEYLHVTVHCSVLNWWSLSFFLNAACFHFLVTRHRSWFRCIGQAAYLSQHHNLDASYQIGFYIAAPGMQHYCYYLVRVCTLHCSMLLGIHTAFASVMNAGSVWWLGVGDLGVGGGQPGHHKQDLLHHQSEPVSYTCWGIIHVLIHVCLKWYAFVADSVQCSSVGD